MKKKLLAILAAFVAVTPLTAVKAEDFDYSLGNEHNFIVNKEQEDKHAEGNEEVGVKMISLGEDPEDPGYVLGLSTGAATFTSKLYEDRAYYESNPPTKFTDSLAYATLNEDFNGSLSDKIAEKMNMTPQMPATSLTTPYVKNFNTDSKYLRVPTSKEVLDWFEYTKVNDNKYTLTAKGIESFKTFYSYSALVIGAGQKIIANNPTFANVTFTFKGYVLGDDPEVTSTDILMWVMIPTYDADGYVTSVSVEKISSNASNTGSNLSAWVMVPVLSFNKTYNCRFDTTKKTACFKCGDKYQWLVVGEQASTCVIDSSKTTKAKCTDNPPTGVEDYILEFAIAAGICGIVLFAIKRKSLFSRV